MLSPFLMYSCLQNPPNFLDGNELSQQGHLHTQGHKLEQSFWRINSTGTLDPSLHKTAAIDGVEQSHTRCRLPELFNSCANSKGGHMPAP